MRPVNRPNGTYYNTSMAAATTLPNNTITRNPLTPCLALCIEEEINRLHAIIGGLPPAGGEALVEAAIRRVVVAAALPVTIPALAIPAVAPGGGFGGFAGGTYDQAIATLPPANQYLVDNYIHYRIIRRNLQYDIGTDTFVATPQLIIADIPYAVSAMQDARKKVRATGEGAQIYSTDAPAVLIGVLPETSNRAFTLYKINEHIQNLYKKWERSADSGPSAYRNAATELIDVLGPYCAYCEINVKTQFHVEHMLPKGRISKVGGIIRQGFPSLAKSWSNFLPACQQCNSTKKDRPSKLDITEAAAGKFFTKDDNTKVTPTVSTFESNQADRKRPRTEDTGDSSSRHSKRQKIEGTGGSKSLKQPRTEGAGDSRITDREYAKLYPDYYQFPLEAKSYKNVGFRLWNVTKAPHALYTETPIPNQLNWTIQKVDEINKEVIVNTPGIVPAVHKFEVHIDQWGAALLPTLPAAQQKVDRMTKICHLNATNANTDRRVLERTEAWFMALEAVNKITTHLDHFDLQSVGDAPAPITYIEIYEYWRDNTIRIIKEKGFLSVWLKIFLQFAHPLGSADLPAGLVPTFPAAPVAGEVFIPMIGGEAQGAPGAAVPARGATIGNLAQDIAQTILQTGAGVNNAAQNAAGLSLGIAAPVSMAGLAAAWAAAGAPARAQAEAAARKAGAAHSRYFPNTNWDQVP
jgi:hypothetical protein